MKMDKDSLDLLSFCVPSVSGIYGYAYEEIGLFSLSDRKTCSLPRRDYPCPEGCGQDILKIETTEPVTVVAFDKWLHSTSDSTCDFGWRDRQSVTNNTGAMRSPRSFTRTPSSEAGISRYSNYTFGENFDFIQVRHPHVFHWSADQ